ncbi:MAG: hypothetical protein C0469_00530 [Cyanobacteria bacterium DS2.3.42]|nr:hypothetical protein [Cyanobacteria bacterium DS2.3.42]
MLPIYGTHRGRAWPVRVWKRPQVGAANKVSELRKNSAEKLNSFALDIVFKNRRDFMERFYE